MSEASIFQEIRNRREKVASILKGTKLSAEKLISSFEFEIRKSQKLIDCNLASVIKCLFECANLALDPSNGKVYLIPVNGNCQLMVGCNGWITLLWRSKKVKNVYAYTVKEEDEFDFSLGNNLSVIHKPKINSKSNIIASYAIVKLEDGELQIKVSDILEINQSREISKSAKSEHSPWTMYFEEMAKVVPLRKIAKAIALPIQEIETTALEEKNIIHHETLAPGSDLQPSQINGTAP